MALKIVRHKRGKDNIVADSLSRVYEDNELMAIHVLKPSWKEELHSSIENDSEAQKLIAQLIVNPVNDEGYTWSNG